MMIDNSKSTTVISEHDCEKVLQKEKGCRDGADSQTVQTLRSQIFKLTNSAFDFMSLSSSHVKVWLNVDNSVKSFQDLRGCFQNMLNLNLRLMLQLEPLSGRLLPKINQQWINRNPSPLFTSKVNMQSVFVTRHNLKWKITYIILNLIM